MSGATIVWRDISSSARRTFTADLPDGYALWVERGPSDDHWSVDVAHGDAWVVRRANGGPTLATAKRISMTYVTVDTHPDAPTRRARQAVA